MEMQIMKYQPVLINAKNIFYKFECHLWWDYEFAGIIKRWNILLFICKIGITMPKMTSHGDLQHLPNMKLQMGLGSV